MSLNQMWHKPDRSIVQHVDSILVWNVWSDCLVKPKKHVRPCRMSSEVESLIIVTDRSFNEECNRTVAGGLQKNVAATGCIPAVQGSSRSGKSSSNILAVSPSSQPFLSHCHQLSGSPVQDQVYQLHPQTTPLVAHVLFWYWFPQETPRKTTTMELLSNSSKGLQLWYLEIAHGASAWSCHKGLYRCQHNNEMSADPIFFFRFTGRKACRCRCILISPYFTERGKQGNK